MSDPNWPIDQIIEFFQPICQSTNFSVTKSPNGWLCFNTLGSDSNVRFSYEEGGIVKENCLYGTAQLSIYDCLYTIGSLKAFFRYSANLCSESAIPVIRQIGLQMQEIEALCWVMPSTIDVLQRAQYLPVNPAMTDFANYSIKFEAFYTKNVLLNVGAEFVIQLDSERALNQKIFIYKSSNQANKYSIYISDSYSNNIVNDNKHQFRKSATAQTVPVAIAELVNGLNP